jgi:hypothetical protein
MIGPVRGEPAIPPSIAAAVTSTRSASEPVAPASPGPSAFAELLRNLASEVSHGEAVMRTALRAGRAQEPLGPAELIALQAGVYRYGETVDLASRLIDRSTSAVKTVLQGQ